MGEFANLQWTSGTKQGKSRPRASLALSWAAALQIPWSRQGLGKHIKGFIGVGGDEQPPREGWGGKVESGGGNRHLSLSLALPGTESQEAAPGTSREPPVVPSCLAEQVRVLCLWHGSAWWFPGVALPHSFPLGRIKLLLQPCNPNASEWGRAWGSVLQGSNRCK